MKALLNAGRDYGWALAIAISLSAIVVFIVASRAEPEIASTVGIDTGVQLPKAPTSPDGRTLCPNGWRSTPGVIPPDAVQQLNPQHVGARSFYVCRKDDFEITMWDNGFVSGYQGNNPLSQEDARRALQR